MGNLSLPLVRDNILFLGSKSIDVNQCDLETVRRFFGSEQKRETLSKNHLRVVEKIVFEHQNFDRIEATLLTEKNEEPVICSFEFFFDKEMLLRESLSIYGEPELVKILFPSGLATYAIWSINLAAEILPEGRIKSLEFLNEKHLRECGCNFCATVKGVSSHLIRADREKIVLQ